MNTQPRLPSKPGDPIPNHRWYNNEQFDYKKYAELKGKVVSYFKIVAKRRSGKRNIERYYKVFESGYMVFVDMTMFKMGVTQGISTPALMLNSNKQEFNKAQKLFLKLLN